MGHWRRSVGQALGRGGRRSNVDRGNGNLRAVELRGPREAVPNSKGREAQGWSWHLQVLARMGSVSVPTLGSQGITRTMCDPG